LKEGIPQQLAVQKLKDCFANSDCSHVHGVPHQFIGQDECGCKETIHQGTQDFEGVI